MHHKMPFNGSVEVDIVLFRVGVSRVGSKNELVLVARGERAVAIY